MSDIALLRDEITSTRARAECDVATIERRIEAIQSVCDHIWDKPELPIVRHSGIDTISPGYFIPQLGRPSAYMTCPKCELQRSAVGTNTCYRCGGQNMSPRRQLDLGMFGEEERARHDIYDAAFGVECRDCHLVVVTWQYDR